MNTQTRPDPAIDRSPWRGRLAILVAVVGIAFVGSRLARAWPRTVPLVYETDASQLDVDIVLDNEAMQSARFRRAANQDPGGVFAHELSLPPGEYQLQITTYDGDGSPADYYERTLTVPAEGTTRFDLRTN